MTIDAPVTRKMPQVIAHRGFSGQYPENTMVSFEQAVKANTDALEGDIRLSKDGELVMMHDLTLQRTTTGTGAVSDHPWFGHIDSLTTKADSPQPIPRLNDVLDLLIRPEVASKEGLYMIVDIKFDNAIEILNRLHSLLNEEYKEHTCLQRQIVIGIWHHDFLDRTRVLFGDKFKVCLIGISLTGARRRFLENVDYLSLPFAALADEDGQAFINEAHQLGKRIFTWTINDVEQMICAVAWGVDGIVGDHVDVMVKHMEDQTSLSHEEYVSYLDSCTHLKHRRRRLYYYCVKKAMQWSSATYIGV